MYINKVQQYCIGINARRNSITGGGGHKRIKSKILIKGSLKTKSIKNILAD